ncbi:MAG: ArsR/SmtB family transcription factor [Candidatus Lokiarchaeia archaeon]
MPKKKKDPKRKKIFEKVGLVFRNPTRVDIVRELQETPQRPIDLAEKIGVSKQQLNYHLKSLKKGGIVQVHKDELPKTKPKPRSLPDMRGVRVNGVDENENIQISYGVELTENGEKIADKFLNILHELGEDETTKKSEKKISEIEKEKEGEK